MNHTIHLANLDDTERLGAALADVLFPGAVIALIGPLGAGKTHLVKAIAAALGANPAVVNSPTFVLIQEYDARLPIYHFDAYRLANEAEFADLGPHEYFSSSGVSLVEWADRVSGVLPSERLEVTIHPTGETSRRIELVGHGDRYRELVRRVLDTKPT